FFSVQRPWIPTKLAALNMVVDAIVSIALYKPFGIAGLVMGTVAGNVVMTILQERRLRAGLNGRLEGRQTLMITARIAVATVLMAVLARALWVALDHLLGTSLVAQIFEVGIAMAVAIALYARLVLWMRVPEARQIQYLVLQRLGRV
ncbi:MAG: polysaccharide biosynthesis C-terminal domain-containing protein, partial [Solirubrobacterales bacterium]|nr:polysaccharide biosynthesis C-terminal domain-containing protein [Solirubrobacterales bacterium]